MMKDIFNIDLFRSEGEFFLKRLLTELGCLGIPLLKSDHLCFRVESSQQYHFYKEHLSVNGLLLTEALVNGRLISTFQLIQPFKVDDQVVELVELPSPKAGADYPFGFEHAEFVIKESFAQFASQFPSLYFTTSGNRNINPELCLKTKCGQAKFHHLSLDRVIEIEDAKIRDIIFDFDGTIIKSREAIYEINRVVFSGALDRHVSIEESKEKFHTEFPKLFDAFGIDCPAKRSQAITAWGEVSAQFHYELFDGIAELLLSLSQRSCRIHLWTARDESSARRVLKFHNLEKFFTTMSFSNLSDSKPHPRSLNFDWRSADKNSFLVIGDSTTDIIGSLNTGALAAAALWDPNAYHHDLVASGAELFFHTVSEFGTWLNDKIPC